jgi:hypothetical protein
VHIIGCTVVVIISSKGFILSVLDSKGFVELDSYALRATPNSSYDTLDDTDVSSMFGGGGDDCLIISSRLVNKLDVGTVFVLSSSIDDDALT